MAWPVVAVGDVKDGYGFVSGCIAKSGIKPPTQEKYEELMCEGIVILCHLFEKYDPTKDKGRKAPRTGGGSRKGVASFAGYASFLLPRKLRDAWHRMHEEYVVKTDENGAKRYVYYESPASLNELQDRGTSGARAEDNGQRRGGLDERNLRRVGDFAKIPLPS